MPGTRVSLRWKFVGVIVALVALVLLANAVVLALLSRRMLQESVEERARAYARLSAGPICEAYETYYRSGYSKFRELLLELLTLEPNIERVTVFDTTGRELFDSPELGETVVEPRRVSAGRVEEERELTAVRALDPSDWVEADGGDRPTFVVYVPWVEEWGRHRFMVGFRFSYATLREAAWTAGRWILWPAAASLCLGFVIAVFLAGQSVGPVETLTQGARELAEGRLEQRISLETGDEFEVLAGTLNQMAERLASTVDDLEASNQVLAGLNRELQDLDRVKSDLLANVSHELRTPLTSIRGNGEALADEILGPTNRAQRDALHSIQRNADRLLSMIEELVGYSGLEGDRISLEMKVFDLVPLVRGAVDALRGTGEGHDFLLETGEGLEPVLGDPDRIAQVLDNLLTNAAKFTPVSGQITIRLSAGEGRARIEVSDTGIGIRPEDRDRVFERFFQADSSPSRRFGGMGLGLAIVKEILDRHGSPIEVESEPGKGTTFRFSLAFASDSVEAATQGETA